MIDFSGYNAKAVEREMLGRVPANIDRREGSIVQTAIGPVAWYLEGVYMLMEQIQNNAYADTAVGGYLDLIVQERGLRRGKATPAVRRGTFDAPVVSGSQFKTINGAESAIFITGEELSSADGWYTYAMTCQASGVTGNRYTGNLLPITAIPDLTSAVLGDIITAGTEEETDEALRSRYFETFRVSAFGGNIQAYRNAILGMSGVGAVQVYPAWQGGGTVLCSILDDSLKPAHASVVAAVQEAVCPGEDGRAAPSDKGYGMAPIGAAVTITTASVLTLHVSCSVEFVSGMQGGAESYRSEIEAKIREYLHTVTKSWGNALKGHTIDYSLTVYVSRIMFAILAIPAIVNVTDVRINGSGGDLHLVETAQLQQIPELGTVVINGG